MADKTTNNTTPRTIKKIRGAAITNSTGILSTSSASGNHEPT
jgi:hypothetical protein